MSLWALPEMVCIRTFGRLEWPVRTLSFSHDGQLLASASEDTVIDISSVETGAQVNGWGWGWDVLGLGREEGELW